MPTPSARSSAQPFESIVQTGAPVLRARAEEIAKSELGSPELRELVQRMIATMRAAPGVGLAAPQIGISRRVAVLEDREEYVASVSATDRAERLRVPFPVRVLINPVLRVIGEERATFFEGCLSVNGFVALVERALEVEVTALDERGDEQVWRVRGWPARILQHEIDHLDGALYIDRMKTRSFATVEQAKAHYVGKPVAEVRKTLGI